MHNRINAGEKQAELNKYRALVLAAIDYTIMMYSARPSAIFPDWEAHFNGLKIQVEEHFNKDRAWNFPTFLTID